MLKIACIVDKTDSAIDRLAKGALPYHDNLDFRIIPFHPKRPDKEQIEALEACRDADVIDFQYFRTAQVIKQNFPWVNDKPQILQHHNPYSIKESDWNDFDLIVANNSSIYRELGQITEKLLVLVPNTIDLDFWSYNHDWEPNNNILMVANRIESKKGILPVAIATKELGLNFHLVGSISDMDYFRAIEAAGVTFHEQISDEELRELYHNSTLVVCNSVDNFESGPLPVLEAMACGTPVLTRNVGHIPDLFNGENMKVSEHDPEDVLVIQDLIFQMLADKKDLQNLREKGWNSAKVRDHERRAYTYQKLYRQVLFPDSRTVSVVIPIYEKPEIIRKALESVAGQTYKNIELIVADDNPESNEQLVKEFSKYVNFPVRYINTSSKDNDYGLARARNLATIQATGEIMVYCDQRMVMKETAVEEFVARIKPKFWLYGKKGPKKEFVENFSCVLRQDVINSGMFCERMSLYGGLSQELRTRIRSQGIQTEYVETAEAEANGKSSNRNRKRQEIVAMKNILWKMYDAE